MYISCSSEATVTDVGKHHESNNNGRRIKNNNNKKQTKNHKTITIKTTVYLITNTGYTQYASFDSISTNEINNARYVYYSQSTILSPYVNLKINGE